MTAARMRAGPVRLDALAAAAGLGAIGAALSVAAPFFDGLVAALGGIALGSWFVRWPFRGGAPLRAGGALAASLLAWSFFLLPPHAVGPFRAAPLGAAGIALWWTARAPTRFGEV